MREKEFLPLITEKLNIASLNGMQKDMLSSAADKRDIILLSPTGSGKTLAFLLPVLKMLKPSTGRVQAVVIAPSRELVIQIAGVARTIAPGYKVTAIYGGHNVADEVNSLSVTPDIIVATPGRLLDHAKRRNVDLLPTRMLVLDEFDKSLELGFEDDMQRLMARLKNVSRFILTSATDLPALPPFVRLSNPQRLDYLDKTAAPRKRMSVMKVPTEGRDKLTDLLRLLANIQPEGKEPQRVIVFVNHRESAIRVADYLKSKGVGCALYHGALDQQEREKAVEMFNNGSRPVLVATDLASRGLDIDGVRSVVHYHQPLTPEAYTHRNGRTARVDSDGDIYVMIGPDEEVRHFVDIDHEFNPDPSLTLPARQRYETLYISAGRKEKISKGDIAGFIIKEGGLDPADVGHIEVRDHYSLAAVATPDAKKLATHLDSLKLKGKRHKIGLAR